MTLKYERAKKPFDKENTLIGGAFSEIVKLL